MARGRTAARRAGAAVLLLALAGCAQKQEPWVWPWEQAKAAPQPAEPAPSRPQAKAPEAVAGEGAVSVGPQGQAEAGADTEIAKKSAAPGVAPPPTPKPQTPEQLSKADLSHDPRVLIGLDFDQASRLLGDPSLREDKPPAKLWLFNGSSCVLRVFFYPTLGDTTYRVLTYEVDGAADSKSAVGGDPETGAFARRCFGELLAQRDVSKGQ